MEKIFLRLALVFCFFTSNSLAFAATSPLQQRAQEITFFFSAQPKGFEKVFAGGFLAAVPPAKLAEVFSDYFRRLGPCLGMEEGKQENFNFLFKEAKVPAKITLDSKEPGLVGGFWLGNPTSNSKSLGGVVEDFKKLPGKVSFSLRHIESKESKEMISLNPREELAIGSAFKLYLLGTLTDQIASGKRKWTDIVPLQEKSISLPSGILQAWPAGSPLTLYTLAGLMISISDNTATDHLLSLLGRQQVEKELKEMGHSAPNLNSPFLSTLEMFKLKGIPGEAEKFLATDEKGRRRFLDKEVAGLERSRIDFPKKPTHIADIEWFASADDLCSAMEALWRKSEKGPAQATRGILAINPGLKFDESKWSYVGYKGGSEPGVLNMTYLLHSRKGDWYLLSAGWNDPGAPLDEGRFFGLMQRIEELIP
ncbi:MAG TPA: hypothetical protein DD435_17240 [Cyanobacteria bacterium UBA8530]|nr:hypothetical protein [Cyanobacteria bacterium UBA8530]